VLGRFVAPAGAPVDLSLLSWNVLADAVAQGSFTRSPPDCLPWEARRERLLAGILEHEGLDGPPDVVCLQEVDHHEDWFAPQLAAVGYEGRFAPKAPGRDGLSLFWRRDRLALSRAEEVRYVEPGTGAPQSQLALLAELRAGDRTVVVATTHLKAKPGFEEVRRAQGEQLLRALEAFRPAGAPLLLAGDFNDVPGSPVHALVEGALGLRGAYAALEGSEPRWTTWKVRAAGEVCRTIDYVWAAGLTPTAALTIPDDAAVGPERLPSWACPSDHLSLLAGFAW
jgi:nocturnin